MAYNVYISLKEMEYKECDLDCYYGIIHVLHPIILLRFCMQLPNRQQGCSSGQSGVTLYRPSLLLACKALCISGSGTQMAPHTHTHTRTRTRTHTHTHTHTHYGSTNTYRFFLLSFLPTCSNFLLLSHQVQPFQTHKGLVLSLWAPCHQLHCIQASHCSPLLETCQLLVTSLFLQ